MTAVRLRALDVLGEGVRELCILGDRIVGPQDLPRGSPTVDCAGLVALPGLVDLHTHLRVPGDGSAETMESGTLAAAHGGYTAVFTMANTNPVADTVAVVEETAARARAEAHCDVYPVAALTKGLRGKELTDIAALAASTAKVRLFSDDGACVADPVVMRDALAAVHRVGGVVAQHAQDPQLTAGAQLNEGRVSSELGWPGWPAVAEEAVIARDCLLAEYTGARLHVCHVSTAGAVDVLRWAKGRGIPVTAEVTPHHLTLDEDLVASRDPVYKVNPPLRRREDVEAVRDALVDGTIDVVATDHAPHSPASKSRPWCEAPMGVLGLETALPVVHEVLVRSGRLTWAGVADRMSRGPARIMGLAPHHGNGLRPGEPATFCLFDPDRAWTLSPASLASASRNTPFEGRSFPGRAVATVVRGSVRFDLDGRLPR